MPLGWIALFLLSFPVLEAIGIFWMAQALGGWTLLWLLADVVVGVWLIKFERVAWSLRLMQAMRSGGNPLPQMLASGRMLLAGGLLAFPGFISDALALILLLLPGGLSSLRRPAPRPAPEDATPSGPTTLDGEFRRESDERLPPR